jgi:MYND finger
MPAYEYLFEFVDKCMDVLSKSSHYKRDLEWVQAVRRNVLDVVRVSFQGLKEKVNVQQRAGIQPVIFVQIEARDFLKPVRSSSTATTKVICQILHPNVVAELVNSEIVVLAPGVVGKIGVFISFTAKGKPLGIISHALPFDRALSDTITLLGGPARTPPHVATTFPLADGCCFKCRCAKPLKCCGACKTARYCSEECQRADWSSHRVLCKAITSMDQKAQ